MEASRFDQISRLFADRRLSRRQAVTASAAALAGSIPIANQTSSQDATPVASPTAETIDGERTTFLFVQSFQSGSIAPKDGVDGTYTITLQHGLGQTLYFSDRPERIVGVAPTQNFLDGLGFSPDNPPNAALVVDTADGNVDIAVVELTNPTFDAISSIATYDISVLQDYAEIDMQLQETMGNPAALAAEFGSSHLFIDDCPDEMISCYQYQNHEFRGTGPVEGTCWNWSSWTCEWCDGAAATRTCNELYPECNNQCIAEA